MQANWSIVLNIILLTGVVIAIFRILRTRKKTEYQRVGAPSLGPQPMGETVQHDDIIAVRKLNIEPEDDIVDEAPDVPDVSDAQNELPPSFSTPPLMMFLLAKA